MKATTSLETDRAGLRVYQGWCVVLQGWGGNGERGDSGVTGIRMEGM